MKKKWYCYVCGKILKQEYNLFSMNESTDRVFLVCDNCLWEVDDKDTIIIRIKEMK